MKKSQSVLAVTADEQNPKDSLDPGRCSCSYTAGSMLGTDLRRSRRRLSSSLQVPPWKPLDRARSPEPDSVQRPTTLPLRIPPRIAITQAEPDRWKGGNPLPSCEGSQGSSF
ncbi:3',5'-cyclic-AMP phosphodiesterase 4B-like isoform X2 [Emydura macquarii macquarii]|uniref:3',5'-cyclic-AMP phosphodiesterase 4B-like isoform X2 n=1 Tax=Emydura macquarii macquarii TaxID=1129001 RepID=UPI00352AD745